MATTTVGDLVTLAVLASLLPLPAQARQHDTLVLSNELSGTAHIMSVDGLTVMSEENYDDRDLVQTAVILPRDKSASLLVQFIYMDIPKARPCADSLHICELAPMPGIGIVHMCKFGMLEKFCGSLDDLLATQRAPSRHYISTTHRGQGIRIQWVTHRPKANHRGFKLVITSFTSNLYCDSATHWRCGDGKCISRDLHCDKVPHCLDKSDETINCTNKIDEASSFRMSCTSDKDMKVCLPGWNEHWLWLIVPMAVVTILLIVAVALKIRQQLVNGGSLSSILHRHRDRFTQTPEVRVQDRPQPSAPPEGDVYESAPMIGVVLPPPYSPLSPDDRGEVKVACAEPLAHHGEPPPLYEDSLQPSHGELQENRSNPEQC